MAKKNPDLKGAPEQSPKAHKEMPPKELEPKGDVQGHRRGEAGQFTDKGAPGMQKY